MGNPELYRSKGMTDSFTLDPSGGLTESDIESVFERDLKALADNFKYTQSEQEKQLSPFIPQTR